MHDPVRFPSRPAPALRVVAVPSSDLEFVRFVREVTGEPVDARTLEDRIRRRYPRARVHPNDLSSPDAVWYAYRDGRWEPGRSS